MKLQEQLFRVASFRVLDHFYEVMLAKFPFSDDSLGFLDPDNRTASTVAGIINLAFLHFQQMKKTNDGISRLS